MPLIINSNINSLRGANSVRKSTSRLADTLRHISSGLRVSRASDDAGRLGSITLAESEVRGLQKSIQNLNDGLSLAQTLEGGLSQMEIILQRIRELSVQASTDTYNAADRLTIHEEASQLLRQIDSIVDQTDFNRIKLLDGSADHIGIYVDDGVRSASFNLDLHDIRDTSVGRKAQYESQRQGVHVSDLADGDITINGFVVRGTTEVDDSVSFSFASGSAIAKANAINAISENTGVTARALENVVIANRQVSAFTLTETQNFKINGVQIGVFEITQYDADGSLRQAINEHHEETGVVASLTGNGELKLVAKDGRNIQIQYSHKNVLESIGLANTTLDPNNLAGDVILGEPDRDLKGTIQAITTTGAFPIGVTQVGGRYDGSEVAKDNYVDFVGHVVQGGALGTAQIVFDRDDGTDNGPAEDFDFIEGSVNPAPNLASVNGSFVTTFGGTITAGGTYFEGLDREYRLEVIQGGSTDGPDPTKRAVVRVSTAEDGILINALTLDAAAGAQAISIPDRGEFVTIDVGPSLRSTTITENNQAQTYDGTLNNGGVTISGQYTGDVSKDFSVRVIEEGYTQDANQAKVEVTERNLVTGVTTTLGSFVVNAGQPITIADGLEITFAAETVTLGALQETDPGAADSYAGNVTIASNASDFIGERGDGSYALEVVNAGPTGQAQYRVTFDGNEIVAAQTLNSGNVVLDDGLVLNFDPSVSVIGGTTVTTNNGDYGDYNGVTIGGNYDGLLNDITVEVRVKSEGRVLAAGEPVTDDAAILEFRLDGGAFQGDIVAVAGQDLALSNGLTVRLDNASAISELTDNAGVVLGANHTFTTGTVQNYEGEVTFDLDQTLLELSEDADIRIQSVNAVIGADAASSSGSIRIQVRSGGVTDTIDLGSVVSGQVQNVIPGLRVTFNNDAPRVDDVSAGFNDNANITLEAGASYNGSLGNNTIDVTYTGDTNQNVVANNGDRVGASLSGTYNGSDNDETYTLTFDGVSQNIARTGGGVDDNANITIDTAYNGLAGDKSLTLTYVGGSTAVSNTQGGGVGPNAADFNVDVSGTYNRSAQNKQLLVAFEGRTGATLINHLPGAGGGAFAAGSLTNTTFDWDAGTHTVEVVFTGDDTAILHVDGAAVGPVLTGATLATIDLGDAAYAGVFNNVDPGVDINVVVDGVGDETGERLVFQFDQIQSVVIQELGEDGDFVDNVLLTNPTTTIDLGNAAFAPLFAGGDPGVDLVIDQATVRQSDTYVVDLTAIREVDVDDGVNPAVRADISSGFLNLGDAQFNGIFGGVDPNVTLGFADTFAGEDDEYTLDLTTRTSVTVVDSNGNLVEANADVSGGSYTIQGTGVDVQFADANAGIDDVVTVTLGIDKTVEVFLGGVQQGGTFDVSGGSLDLGAVFGGNDPGFDLDVANPVNGRDDTFTFELTRDRDLDNGVQDLLNIDQRTLATNDLFTAEVDAGTLEVGTSYEVQVDAPTLEVGKEYNIQERVGTLNAGDIIKINAQHAFDSGPITLEQTTTLSNGIQLEFNPGANFAIGDEIRFQALQYQGDPTSSGPYDDPAFPTTFEVEVIATGAVDGGAQLQYTRVDNGDTGVVAAASNATLLQNNVHISFSAGTLYAGDRFFIETVSDLSQDFGAKIQLESSEGIEIQLTSVTIDNELGRLLYVGDPALANLAGTFDSLTNAFLGVNDEETLSGIDLTSKKGAQEALEVVDLVLGEVSGFRSQTGAMQNRIERQLGSLSQALFQTESYVSRIRDADIASEAVALAQNQIIQQAGVQMLAQMNFSNQIVLQLLQ